MSFQLRIDGRQVEASAGETVLDAAQRAGVEIPTLCHEPRLDPSGCCRMCLVEVSGQRRLQPACRFPAEPGQEVDTGSDRVLRHRRVLTAMYQADLPAGALAQRSDLSLPPVASPRKDREDDNPYIRYEAAACILCGRCVRYCDQVEGVSAIGLVGRGGATTIGTADSGGLLQTTCELCGGCVSVCPTGALSDKAGPGDERVRTTCGYCGVGCQLDLHVREGRVVRATPPPSGETVNDGNLCIKGRYAIEWIHSEDRLTHPLIRGADGQLHEASWPDAIDRAARGLLAVRERHGPDDLAFISSSRCTGEENYLLQKLARAAFGTNNCHQCAAT